ncbi:hypothetical protein HETIRDRAFT_107078 [Heterobasidion irregulare TC 32-1]|uniref:Uncharacterized protein n=1 Tax=Heterobasidion irregulare (strain TC 32-1) TaxID=747525 RepID=W4KC52_HETIT|nr:uncharacterized protein HETIRDRAFT_107078 [Heterobasidion irregulare TC 32-1]ETW82920.1 hypothetical protein HETIRDRAFT_107078 [Heterobasidion irregulare TC 32-1]
MYEHTAHILNSRRRQTTRAEATRAELTPTAAEPGNIPERATVSDDKLMATSSWRQAHIDPSYDVLLSLRLNGRGTARTPSVAAPVPYKLARASAASHNTNLRRLGAR